MYNKKSTVRTGVAYKRKERRERKKEKEYKQYKKEA